MKFAMYAFNECASDNPLSWPLWWLRYALLRRRLQRVANKYGRGTFEAGYYGAPLMYNVFRHQWIGVNSGEVDIRKKTVTDMGDHERVQIEVATKDPAAAGAYKWALERGLV